METIGGGVVQGNSVNPERGERKDRKVQIQRRHDLQSHWQTLSPRVRSPDSGSQQQQDPVDPNRAREAGVKDSLWLGLQRQPRRGLGGVRCWRVLPGGS